jgi:hypothetical protein
VEVSLNQLTQEFILENWELLLDTNAESYLSAKSPLRIPYAMLNSLKSGPLSLQELSDRLGVHINTIATISRLLEGKLFERSPINTNKGASRKISLLSSLELYSQASHSLSTLKRSNIRKVQAHLPEKQFFKPLQSQRPNFWLFEDCDSRTLRIVSPEPSPWGKEWTIIFSHQSQKGDGSIWPYRLDLRLHPIHPEHPAPKAYIEREVFKGHFAWSTDQPCAFYVFPLQEKFWLSLSIYLVP